MIVAYSVCTIIVAGAAAITRADAPRMNPITPSVFHTAATSCPIEPYVRVGVPAHSAGIRGRAAQVQRTRFGNHNIKGGPSRIGVPCV